MQSQDSATSEEVISAVSVVILIHRLKQLYVVLITFSLAY